MITNLTLFLTSQCNLQCKYCYIDKNQYFLNKVDQQILKINSNIYFDQIINYESNIKNTVQSVTLWGGEPFLCMSRAYVVLQKYLDYFPNLHRFFISTNFSLNHEIDSLLRFIKFLQKYDRHFIIDLQLSIDGYEEMNDFGRGRGTTKKIIENFKKLQKIYYDKEKITLNVFPKPTLYSDNLKFLLSEEDCKKWFEFFEQFGFNNPIWNFAGSNIIYSKTDGENYKQICQNLINLNRVIPEVFIMESEQQCCDCGVIPHNLTIIGDDQYIVCHRGWFDDLSSQVIYNKEELKELQTNILCARESAKQNTINTIINYVQGLAVKEEIDPKYINEKEILPTLDLFVKQKYCPLNNYLETGYWNIQSDNLIRLYYNGAMDLMLEQLEKRRK